MGTQRALFYFALFSTLLFVPSFSASIYFNQTQAEECQREFGGCAFDNSSIWENNTIPTILDSVFINGNTTSDLLIYTTNITSFSALHLWSVTFSVLNTLTVGYIHQEDNSSIILETGTLTITPNNTYHLPANASLVLHSNTTFNIPIGEFFGTLEVQSGAQLVVANVTNYAPISSNVQERLSFGNLNIPPSTSVSFPEGLLVNVITVQESAHVDVGNGLFGAQVTVIGNSSISIDGGASLLERNNLPPIYGQGLVEILSKEATIQSFQNLEFNGTLSFGDVDWVYISNLTVQNLLFSAGSHENPPNVTGDGLILVVATIFGNVFAEGFGIAIENTLILDGNISVNRSTLFVAGSLSLTSGSYIFLELSQIQLGGIIIVENFAIPENSSLVVTSPRGSVVGNLYNHGTITAGTSNQLSVEDGNFTQHHVGILSLGVATGSISPVTVNGSVDLSGNIHYTLAKKPVLKSSEKYLVISVSGRVNGTFETSASPTTDSSIQRNLSLQYNEKDVYIVYNFHPDDVDIWMWAVLGVVIAVVIIVIVAIVVRLKRKRTAYQQI